MQIECQRGRSGATDRDAKWSARSRGYGRRRLGSKDEIAGREGHRGGDGKPVDDECHVDRPIRPSHLAELSRAIERVDDPNAAAIQAVEIIFSFFGENRVGGVRLAERPQQ